MEILRALNQPSVRAAMREELKRGREAKCQPQQHCRSWYRTFFHVCWQVRREFNLPSWVGDAGVAMNYKQNCYHDLFEIFHSCVLNPHESVNRPPQHELDVLTELYIQLAEDLGSDLEAERAETFGTWLRFARPDGFDDLDETGPGFTNTKHKRMRVIRPQWDTPDFDALEPLRKLWWRLRQAQVERVRPRELLDCHDAPFQVRVLKRRLAKPHHDAEWARTKFICRARERISRLRKLLSHN